MDALLASAPALALAGLVAGGILALTGAGGSVLTLPLLIVMLRLDPHHAVAASLVSVGATAAVGALGHRRQGHVRLRAASLFALGGVLGAALGGRLGRELPASLMMSAFGLLMLYVSTRMARHRDAGEVEGAGPASRRLSGPALAATGGGVGLLSGVLGIGGGFLIVPALARRAGMPMKEAIGTSLAIIAVNAGAGLAGALTALEGVPWGEVLPFVGGSLAGGWLGALLVATTSARRLTRVFSLVVALVGLGVIARYALWPLFWG